MKEDQNIESALQRLSDLTQYAEETAKYIELKSLVKEFFEDYLFYEEESDSGNVFNPITLSCCRVMMIKPLNELLKKMRELSGARTKL